MEENKKNSLRKHYDSMGLELTSLIDKYCQFVDEPVPRISIVCTDMNVRYEASKALTERDDVFFQTYLASEEINIEDQNSIIFCDAIIVCTRAKNIAPKGLYDLLKQIEKYDKPIYVVLAGWSNLPRSKTMADDRRNKAFKEFEFVRIVEIYNVFSEAIEGYFLWDDISNKIMSNILVNFKSFREHQSEYIFRYLKQNVRDFYDHSRLEIYDILKSLNKDEEKAVAKQDYYNIVFKNLSVSIQDIENSVGQISSDISFYDISNDNGEKLTEIYSRSGMEAQKTAKDYLKNELVHRAKKIQGNYDDKIKIDVLNCVNDCVNEMSNYANEISKRKYISEELSSKLLSYCQDEDKLQILVERYSDSHLDLIEDFCEKIPSVIDRYVFEMNLINQTRDDGKKILEFVNKQVISFFTDENNGDDEGEYSIEEDNKEKELEETILRNASIDELLTVDHFQADIEHLLMYSNFACEELAHKCSENIKKDIVSFTERTLNLYFSEIIQCIESIQIELRKTIDDYYLE